MRATGALLCILFYGLLANGLRADETATRPLAPGLQQAIEAAVKRDLAAYGGRDPVPGAVVGVWAPDKGIFVRGFGLSDLSPRRAMAIDDHFRIGSNTKTFVVTLLLQLVDEKKLSLDDTVAKFDIGVTVPNADRMTLRDLARMQSGIVDAYSVPAVQKINMTAEVKITPRELITIAASVPPLFAPGTKWNYSNTNYLLLGLIIEAVTHDRIEREIERRILGPLALTQTSFPTTDPGMPKPYAHGYMLDDHSNWVDNTTVMPPSLTWAAGVMISDMADMKRWVKAYVTGATNSVATQRERLSCVPTGQMSLRFGLGIGCAAGWYGYTGGMSGYNTAAYYLPEKDATIIAFVNTQTLDSKTPGPANTIFRDIARIVYPDHVPFNP
jgi:D-alanyl-D-alanine carboxypeptidase